MLCNTKMRKEVLIVYYNGIFNRNFNIWISFYFNPEILILFEKNSYFLIFSILSVF